MLLPYTSCLSIGNLQMIKICDTALGYQNYVMTEDVQYISLPSLEISLYFISLSFVLFCFVLFSRDLLLCFGHTFC